MVMKTKAKVILVNHNTGMVAVETPTCDITVFELLGCETVKLGAVLSGYWQELDNQVVVQETRHLKLNVFVHECGCELDNIQERYFIPRAEAPTELMALNVQEQTADASAEMV